MDHIFIALNNLMMIREHKGLGPYEILLYRQLLVTATQKARLEELLLMARTQRIKNGEGIDSTAGGASQQGPESKEHRVDDPPA